MAYYMNEISLLMIKKGLKYFRICDTRPEKMNSVSRCFGGSFIQIISLAFTFISQFHPLFLFPALPVPL